MTMKTFKYRPDAIFCFINRITLLFIFCGLIVSYTNMNAQDEDPGRIVFDDPHKPKKDEPLQPEDIQPRRNGWGVDLMVSDDGFGIGFWYLHEMNETVTASISTSFSEAKDPREFNIYTYYGEAVPLNKVNRIFRIPLFFGAQYRLFKDDIIDNFRPYLNAGAGPVFIYTTPASEEFFNSFGKGHPYYTYGGFAGIGAQFGFDRSSIIGVNFRYYFIPLPAGIRGVLEGPKGNANGFFITLNFGAAY